MSTSSRDLNGTKDTISRMVMLEALLQAHDGEAVSGGEPLSEEELEERLERDFNMIMRSCGDRLVRIQRAETEEGAVGVLVG